MEQGSARPLVSSTASRRRCVLVVEDEFLIRTLVSEELRDAKFEVIEACNADEALAILHAGTDVDLVFSDVRMPGTLDGLELLAVVRELDPRLPVVITSGHLSRDTSFADGVTQFLPKPYSARMVLNLIDGGLAKSW